MDEVSVYTLNDVIIASVKIPSSKKIVVMKPFGMYEMILITSVFILLYNSVISLNFKYEPATINTIKTNKMICSIIIYLHIIYDIYMSEKHSATTIPFQTKDI